LTGYSVTGRNLAAPYNEWQMGGIPLINFLHIKEKSSYGVHKLVISSSEVDLNAGSF
jgi:hypothetical protein